MQRTARQIGLRVLERRQLVGWTQASLAERVGISVETVSRLERGAAMPSIERLSQIAHALDADLVDLLGAAPQRPATKHERAIVRVMAALRTCDAAKLEMIGDVVERIVRG
jgi:transcriptional regulator with XRE-family HTH domain